MLTHWHEYVGLGGIVVAVIGVMVAKPGQNREPNKIGFAISATGMVAFVFAAAWKYLS